MLLTLVRTQQHLVSHYNHKENKHDKENNICYTRSINMSYELRLMG